MPYHTQVQMRPKLQQSLDLNPTDDLRRGSSLHDADAIFAPPKCNYVSKLSAAKKSPRGNVPCDCVTL